MNNESNHKRESTSVPPSKPARKSRMWIKVVMVALVLYFIPLPGYVWRLGEAVAEHGLSRQTLTVMARHTGWFVRYFTGPPSDEEMIQHFHQHRADLERAAHFYATHGYCHNRQTPESKQECEKLQQRTGMQVGLGAGFLLNSVYRRLGNKCDSGCDVQRHSFFDREPQDWWRSWNISIKSWRKSLLYVPPLLPAPQFGLSATTYPDDPVKLMVRQCHLKSSLDSVPTEIEKTPLAEKDCAIRHIEGQWFIVLEPHVSL